MTTASGAEQVRRNGVWASWAPSGRAAVPAILLLVIIANLVGVTTVVLLLIGVEDGGGSTGRGPVLPLRRSATSCRAQEIAAEGRTSAWNAARWCR